MIPTYDDVVESFRPLAVDDPDGVTHLVGMTRVLTLDDLQVTAHAWLEGSEISLKFSDPENYITADEWPVVQRMIESQFLWGAACKVAKR